MDQAIAYWTQALKLDEAGIARFQAADFVVADLAGATLAETRGSTVLLDSAAAGYGWFVDMTPGDDGEFTIPVPKAVSPGAGTAEKPEGMDLLTVVMHELGHVLGFKHSTAEGPLGTLMQAALAPSTRWSLQIVGGHDSHTSLGPTPTDDTNPVSWTLFLDAGAPLWGLTSPPGMSAVRAKTPVTAEQVLSPTAILGNEKSLAADNARLLHDAVWHEKGAHETSSANVDWLFDFDLLHPKNGRAAEPWLMREAIDRIFHGDW